MAKHKPRAAFWPADVREDYPGDIEIAQRMVLAMEGVNGGQDDAASVPAVSEAETVSTHAAGLVAVAIGHNTVAMVEIAQKIIFYVVLTDRDRWAVEVEWPDGTLERVDTFGEHSLATYWVATQSHAWLEVRRIFSE